MIFDKADERPGRVPDHLQMLSIRIGELSPDQWTILRDLKLRSLDQEPIAFADPEEERVKYLQRSEKEWRAILSGKMSGGREGETIMVFAEDNGHYVGMVSAIIPTAKHPEAVKATIQHMYVDNQGYRGLGVGRQLLSALLEKLKVHENVKKAELSVVATQLPARRLYERTGFRTVKTVEGGAKRGRYVYDEFEMELDL